MPSRRWGACLALLAGLAAFACVGNGEVARSSAGGSEAGTADARIADARTAEAGGGEAGGGEGRQGSAGTDEDSARRAATAPGPEEGAHVLEAGQPVTLRLPLPPRLAAAVRAAAEGRRPAGTLRLTLAGVEHPGTGGTGVRLFLNQPDADLSTPLDDPHYVGETAFFPLVEEAAGERQSFLFDAGPVLARLGAADLTLDDPELSITLILVPDADSPLEGRAPPGLAVEGVSLEWVEAETVGPQTQGSETEQPETQSPAKGAEAEGL